MIIEDISVDEDTGIIQILYEGEYPSEKEIISEVCKYFVGNHKYQILDIDSDGTSGRIFINQQAL